MENCLRASQSLLIALRLANGDERIAIVEISAAMDTAKNSIKVALEHKPRLLKQVLGYFEKRWENQMEPKLYVAALFLNAGKFFAIRENNKKEASRLKSMFNDVHNKQSKITKQADDYERSEDDSFSKPIVIKDRERKNPSK
ncbi:hypothetical protein GUJ93_ZPchr0010g10672 [Zizania palustris]|uniref:Uncharacterized protein n=1 Tax=Zizania palustris TaxID=103762 RepID=A0A8J5WHX5_ZIZPA|nr:hypothetical protein GUJ93_ZPchr0010g10672 [Zizania palustris]